MRLPLVFLPHVSIVQLHANDVVIEGNTIEPGPAAFGDWGNGVHTLGTFLGGTLAVQDNDISVSGFAAHGVFQFGENLFNGPVLGSVIANNRIHATDAFSAVGLYGQVSDSHVNANQMSGAVGSSLILAAGILEERISADVFQGDETASENVFIGNRIVSTQATLADVFFDAHTSRNILAGHAGDVIDLGTDNRITGSVNSLPRGIGGQIGAMHVSPATIAVVESGSFETVVNP